MRRLNITDVLEEGPFLDVERPFYNFRAVCTSDECRTDKKKVIKSLTGPGVVKEVKKTVNWCPDCGDALFWEKTRAK